MMTTMALRIMMVMMVWVATLRAQATIEEVNDRQLEKLIEENDFVAAAWFTKTCKYGYGYAYIMKSGLNLIQNLIEGIKTYLKNLYTLQLCSISHGNTAKLTLQ